MDYTIKPGDTLTKIANQYGTSVAEILKANPSIINPNRITIDQTVVIPKPINQRPTFGGGMRPTQNRMVPQVCGASELLSDMFGVFNQMLTRDIDDLLPVVSPTTVENKHLKNAPWMETAIDEIGVAEHNGMNNANPRILEYFKASRFWGKDDTGGKNAWCGSFIAWVMQKNGITPVSKAYRAKEWENFGDKIDKPVYGAIGIKSRKGGGHVAFIVGQSKDGKKYYMLGGNQDNKVQISEYPKEAWKTFVFPPDHDATKGELPVYDEKSAKAGSES